MIEILYKARARVRDLCINKKPFPAFNHLLSFIMPLSCPPTQTFETLEEATKVVQEFALSEGYSTKKARTKTDCNSTIRKVWLACAHGGEHKKKGMNVRQTSTRLLKCPWSMTVTRKLAENNRLEWVLAVVDASHNHDATNDLAAFPEARALTQEQEQQIVTLSKGGAPPRLILSTMRAADLSFRATGQDIYNVKKRDRAQFLLGRTPLEALLENMEENQVQYKLDRDAQHQLTRLLIAPKTSISIYQEFSSGGVLLMDSTYKTNR